MFGISRSSRKTIYVLASIGALFSTDVFAIVTAVEVNVKSIVLSKKVYLPGETIRGWYTLVNSTKSFKSGDIYIKIYNDQNEIEDSAIKRVGLDGGGVSITGTIDRSVSPRVVGKKRLEISAAFDSDSVSFDVVPRKK